MKRLEFSDTPLAPAARQVSFKPAEVSFPSDGGQSQLRQRRPNREATPYVRRTAEELYPEPDTPAGRNGATPSRQQYQGDYYQSPYAAAPQYVMEAPAGGYPPQPQPVYVVQAPTHGTHRAGHSSVKKRPPSSGALHAAHLNIMSPEADMYSDLIMLDPMSQRKRRRQGVYGPHDSVLAAAAAARAYPMALPPQFRPVYSDVFAVPQQRLYDEYVKGAHGANGYSEDVDVDDWEEQQQQQQQPRRRRQAKQQRDNGEGDVDVDVDVESAPAPSSTRKRTASKPRVRFSSAQQEAGGNDMEDEEAAEVQQPRSKKRTNAPTPYRPARDVDDSVFAEDEAEGGAVNTTASPHSESTANRSSAAQEIACQTSPALKPVSGMVDPSPTQDNQAKRGRPTLKASALRARPPWTPCRVFHPFLSPVFPSPCPCRRRR